jgi:hypothetical protein
MVDRRFQQRQTLIRRAENRTFRHGDAAQRQLGDALAVLRVVAVDIEAGGVGIDEKERDALAVAPRSGGPGADDQLVGATSKRS